MNVRKSHAALVAVVLVAAGYLVGHFTVSPLNPCDRWEAREAVALDAVNRVNEGPQGTANLLELHDVNESRPEGC